MRILIANTIRIWKTYTPSVIFEKHYYDCDIVDALILPLPRLHCRSLEILNRRVSVIADPGLLHYCEHLLLADELPQAIGSDYYEFVFYA